MSETTLTQRWICESCGFIYDPADGDPDGGIPPGTAFDDIPDTWYCPVCVGTPVSRLVLVGDEVLLACAADGAVPSVGDVVEGRPRGDAAVGVALRGVVDEPAGLADPPGHGRARAAHVRASVRNRLGGRLGRVSDERPATGEHLNDPGVVSVPRQA